MYQPDQLYFIALANTLGHSILIETLKSAAYYVTHSDSTHTDRKITAKLKEGYSCFLFIQGTGLDIILNDYALNYSSDKIKDEFNKCLHQNIQPLVA